MNRSIPSSTSAFWRIAALVLALVAVLALLWLASEEHYQSCVNAAVASTPDLPRSSGPPNPFDQLDYGPRPGAVAECSHSPF